MLGQVVHSLPEDIGNQLAQVLDQVVHHTRELKDSVMSMRAQQVGAVFQRMPQVLCGDSSATKTAKKVRLEMVGGATEVDRSIIERLGDPLTHIIRNSIDHGIELPTDRAARGSPKKELSGFRQSTAVAESLSRFAMTVPALTPSACSGKHGSVGWLALMRI